MKSISKNFIQQTLLVAILGCFSVLSACSQEAETFDEQLKELYSYEVPLLKADELKQKLAQEDTVYLLDTRTPREYAVSRLKHSERVGYDDFDKASVKDIPKDATVVTYCTVGYRSEKIGAKLEAMGYQHVFNLYGSMISWSNQGYPVYGPDGKPTQKVHTHSKQWARYLEKGKAVYD